MDWPAQTHQEPRRRMRWMLLGAYGMAGAMILGAVWLLMTGRSAPTISMIRSWQLVFIACGVFGVMYAVYTKARTRLMWESVFALTVMLGVWFVSLLVLPFEWAIGVASLLTLLQFFVPYVGVHNVLYLVGCVGVALNIAGWLAPDVLLIGLVLFSMYDTVAGAPGGAVEVLSSKLAALGIIPGLVIPSRTRDLGVPLQAVHAREMLLLGAGDLILPLALVAKASLAGISHGGIVLAGLVLSGIVMGRVSDGHPRSSLPIIAAGAALPFVVLRAIGSV